MLGRNRMILMTKALQYVKQSLGLAVMLALPWAAYAGCGGGAANPLAQIPNLAPATTTPPGTPPKPPEVLNKVPGATAVAVPTPPPAVGKVVWVKGIFQAIAPDRSVRSLASDAVVYQHDVLQTKKGGQAQVVFSDHTMMTFSEGTTVYLNKYEFNPKTTEGSAGKFVMDLIEGGYRTVTGAIAKSNPPDYQINTEVATIGVRGTDYAANIQACKLLMKNNKGTPVVQNDHGTLVLTKAAPYAAVEANKPPIVLKTEPPIFKQQLPIIPATFVPVQSAQVVKEMKVDANKLDSGSGGGGGGKACGVPGSTGDMMVKIKQ